MLGKNHLLLKKYLNSGTDNLGRVEGFLHWRFLKGGKINLPFRLSW